MTTYHLFGLALESALDFPELVEAESKGSAGGGVRLTLESVTPPRPPDSKDEHWFGVREDEAWFDWKDVAAVHIAGGRTIRLDPDENVDEAGLRSAILGPAFSVLLAQRGLFPLHASSVIIGDRAAAFAGAAGAGKSTLAVKFHEHGYEFLSDDVSALDVSQAQGEPVVCYPAYPQCKLSPEFYEHRNEDWRSKPRVNPDEEKRAHPMEGSARHAGLPLGAVYLLEDGEPAFSERLPDSEALFEALRHVHRPSLMERVMTHGGMLKRAAALVAAVPFYRLRRPRSLDGLSDVVTRVAEHLAR